MIVAASLFLLHDVFRFIVSNQKDESIHCFSALRVKLLPEQP